MVNVQLFVAYIAFHIFGYAGGTALNSYYDRDTGPVGGLAHPPPVPPHLLEFSLIWQGIGFLLTLTLNATVASIYFVMFWMSLAYSHPRTRWKGKPITALLTVMIGQGILPFYAGWATATGSIATGLNLTAIIAAFSATLIVGGLYPLTQIYQLDQDSYRGDLTVARRLGINASFRFASFCILIGGAGAIWVAATQFTRFEALGLTAFIVFLEFAIARWHSRFPRQNVMQNFRTLMQLYAAVTLPFLAWISFRLLIQT